MANEAFVSQIDAAMQAHAAWKEKLTTAIRVGAIDVTPETIACDDKCAFGQWIHGPMIEDAVKARKPFQVTKRLHAEFHQTASRVAQMAEKGEKGPAYKLMDGEYAVRSDRLERALHKWRGELTG